MGGGVLTFPAPSAIIGGMVNQKKAQKIVDSLADSRLTLNDVESIGFHVVNLSTKDVRKNALILADSILYHDTQIPNGVNDASL